MAQQVQERINVRMKGLDDVFHNVMISLERLESFLEIERRGEKAVKTVHTAVSTPRDLHDDQKTPPTRESIIGEVQLQCSALFFQTKFDDDKLFRQTMQFFMNDLLQWYGGRDRNIPFDEVEMYVLPVIMSLSRYQVESVADIMKVCDQYVVKLRRIEDFTDEEKEKAVEEGFIALIKGQDHTEEQIKKFIESGAEVSLTAHQRGTAVDGYKRLMQAMVSLYNETTPAKTVRQIFNAYVEGLPKVTDEEIEAAVKKHGSKQESEGSNVDDGKEDANPMSDKSETGDNPETKETKTEKGGLFKRWFK
jgi:hypothetical protein